MLFFFLKNESHAELIDESLTGSLACHANAPRAKLPQDGQGREIEDILMIDRSTNKKCGEPSTY
jgi:hypothetical protein